MTGRSNVEVTTADFSTTCTSMCGTVAVECGSALWGWWMRYGRQRWSRDLTGLMVPGQWLIKLIKVMTRFKHVTLTNGLVPPLPASQVHARPCTHMLSMYTMYVLVKICEHLVARAVCHCVHNPARTSVHLCVSSCIGSHMASFTGFMLA